MVEWVVGPVEPRTRLDFYFMIPGTTTVVLHQLQTSYIYIYLLVAVYLFSLVVQEKTI